MNVLGLLLVVAYAGFVVSFVWAAVIVILVGRRWLKLHPTVATSTIDVRKEVSS